MTDLLTRVLACYGNPRETAALILGAWLVDNPEPDGIWNDLAYAVQWRRGRKRLCNILAITTPGALLGAVIDFILPKGWIIAEMSELPDRTRTFASICGPEGYEEGAGSTFATALLAACIKARNASHE